MDEVTEEMRLRAIDQLMVWKRRDVTVRKMIDVILRFHNEPSVGHLARNNPSVFDALYEECSGMVRNPT